MAPSSSFKDGAYLLVTALACAGASWLAFAFFGEAVFYGLFGLSWLALSLDNVRLRRQLRKLQDGQAP
ncbi:hypothetical protein AVMA1855_24310 [Acidovorax sp. SUPP1855]|uniref:hypothetical protein n=1 Tax=unclassified Acidovorax TaxID=2684926 RepID=UPI0023DE5C1C|nr:MULTISPECIES: hypothetical protein [unclassified Acidovorax]GKS87336.1 hypothetical protein AVMA1855_24310 [Acidovorax sp. SUPP1855]GKS98260.1 hypothetical protein AVKW3434_02750 [Acidovorax sp. SUPP3434]